jgi:hypothetical protein
MKQHNIFSCTYDSNRIGNKLLVELHESNLDYQRSQHIMQSKLDSLEGLTIMQMMGKVSKRQSKTGLPTSNYKELNS